MKRYVCIHGHFYQPPRENPWLEAVEVQDSAYPFHDWNERINAECYEVNGMSRILDHEDRIIEITNNYARISFNFGPTLLSWLERHAPITYEKILEADRESAERFSGHGSAMAQVYNHMIMPLASRRDKVTQVRWGMADFRRRFGRDPEGMWLPETAVDIETLEVLAEHEIRFTVLAPKQAGSYRRIGEERWNDVPDESIDPTLAYRQMLPSGRSIDIFFYDGPVSQALAFERLLHSSQTFCERLIGAFPKANDNEPPRLMHIATDGETYGHHHRYGDMALAAALKRLEDDENVDLTNYGEFLERHPPEHEVQIVESTSWSCVHGVERWRSDCGCHSGAKPEWNQAWRKPLRESLDWLCDEVAPKFEGAAKDLFDDPWAVRDAYVDVVLDRATANVDSFFAAHSRESLNNEQRIRALQLMELQRNCMLMYTSCGWFFDDISRIEAVQVLEYASRALQLVEQLFGTNLELPFLERLEGAPSNVTALKNGRVVYERLVRPARIDLEKVAGHYAMSSLFEAYPPEQMIYCYEIESEAYRRVDSGRAHLAIGRARVRSIITEEQALLSFGVLHLGDHNLLSSVRHFRDDQAYDELARDIEDSFRSADFAETIQRIDRHFGDHRYSLRTLFRDEQRKILSILLDSTLQGIETAYRHIYEDNESLMRALGAIGVPISPVLRTTAEFVINRDLRAMFQDCGLDTDRLKMLLDDARDWGLELDTEGLSYALQNSIEDVAKRFEQQPDQVDLLSCLNRLAGVAGLLTFEIDLWLTQNIYYKMLHEVYPERVERAESGDPAAREWVEQFQSLGEKLKVKVL